MASAESEPITGVYELNPQRGSPGAVTGAKSPEAECSFCFCVSKESCKFAPIIDICKSQ